MKIFQISDLHLNEEFDFNQNMINQMTEIIAKETGNDKIATIICCGDITDHGQKDFFKTNAKKVFDYISERLLSYKIKPRYIFVPGNHDFCKGNFSDFQAFISNYSEGIDFLNQNVVLYNTEDFDYLLINSSFHKDYTYGNIDLKEIKEKISLSSNPVIIVMHHTLMSRYDNDRSGINNAYALLDLLQSNNIIALIHGHTHGYSNILLGQSCRVIGVGSLFAYFKNCNNQFNVIEIGCKQVTQVSNYRFYSDLNTFRKELLFRNQSHNSFKSSLVSNAYEQVRETVHYFGGISNLNLTIENSFDNYQKDMNVHFKEDIETATLWLSKEIPDTLYYNHGYYMNYSNKKGVDYVIDELKRNSTSNRAIIPLLNLKNVIELQFSYLPGLNSIQFGFLNDEKKELICTMYLRSLEVNHFLRINLSEIYLLISQIHNEIRSIKSVIINVYAFKAQYKEDFSCFKKAKIDVLTPPELSVSVFNKDIRKILELVKDKFEMQETVVNLTGLSSLYDFMRYSGLYNTDCTNNLLYVINSMKELDAEYRKNSDYSDENINNLEIMIREKQKQFLASMEEPFKTTKVL